MEANTVYIQEDFDAQKAIDEALAIICGQLENNQEDWKMKETKLFISQYGDKFYAETIKELRQQIAGKCQRMFVDTKDGKVLHVGYVIGKLWLTMYVPYSKEVR